jgi:glycosyltransferase involved in cell wall biosynthesis
VSDVPPQPGYPNGYSARYYHFLRVLATRWPLDVIALHVEGNEWTQGEFLPPDIAACHQWVEHYPANPLNEMSTTGRLRRLKHYLLDHLPYMAYPRALQHVDSHWMQHAPELAIFLLPNTAHLAFSLPHPVPSVLVLEEGWHRALDWSNVERVKALRGWIRQGEFRRHRTLYREIARRGYQVVVISDHEKEVLSREIPPERISVIPHGVDTDYFRPTAAEQDIDVALVGRMSEERNYRSAVQFFMHARNNSPSDFRWAFVGRRPHVSVESLRSDSVLVTGFVPDTRPYYARSRVVVVPSTFGTGVKTTILEAWAMGKPVVATPFALEGLPARPGENVLVGASDEDLWRNTVELLSSPDLRLALGTAGRSTVEAHRSLYSVSEEFLRVCLQAAEKVAEVH